MASEDHTHCVTGAFLRADQVPQSGVVEDVDGLPTYHVAPAEESKAALLIWCVSRLSHCVALRALGPGRCPVQGWPCGPG